MVANFSTAKQRGSPLFYLAIPCHCGHSSVAPLPGVWYHGDGGGGLLL